MKKKYFLLILVFLFFTQAFSIALCLGKAVASDEGIRDAVIEKQLRQEALVTEKEASRAVARAERQAKIKAQRDEAESKKRARIEEAARLKAQRDWRKEQDKQLRSEAESRIKLEKAERLRRVDLEKEERQERLAREKAEREWRKQQTVVAKPEKGSILEKQDKRQQELKERAEKELRLLQDKQAKKETEEIVRAGEREELKINALEKAEKRLAIAKRKAEAEEELAIERVKQATREEELSRKQAEKHTGLARTKSEEEWNQEQRRRAKEEAWAKAKSEREEQLKGAALAKEERQQEKARAKAEREWKIQQAKLAKDEVKIKVSSQKQEKVRGVELKKEDERQQQVKEQADRQWRLEQEKQERQQAEERAKLERAENMKKAALAKAERDQEIAREKAEKERALAEERSRKKQKAAIDKIKEDANKQELVSIREIQQQELNKMKAEQAYRLEQAKIAREEAETEVKIQNEMKVRKFAEAKAEQMRKESESIERKKQERNLADAKAAARADEAAKIKAEDTRYAKLRMLAKNQEEKQPASQEELKIQKINSLWLEAKRLYSQGMYNDAIRNFQKVIELEGNPRIKYTPLAKELIEKSRENMAKRKKEMLTSEIAQTESEMLNDVLQKQIPPYIDPPPVLEKNDFNPLVEPPLIRKKLKEKRITLDFDKVDLKSVVSFLFQETGINFVTSQKVQELAPKVTVRFKDTALDEVIKYITKSLGLVYRIDKDIVWIAVPDEVANEAMETRVYFLAKGAGLFTEFSPMSSSSSETGLGGSSSQINKIFTLEDTLKEIISWPSDSKMVYDKRINALIVRNTPQNLQMLEDMLYTLDITPTQVLIEARFIEIDVTDVSELGLEWQLNADFPVNKKQGLTVTEMTKNSGMDFTNFARMAEGFNLTYKGVLTTPQFQTVLHLLAESKKVKTLSSPRITTLSNQLATIKVVDEWIYPTRYEYEVVQTDLNGDGDFSDPGETTYKNVPKDFLRRDVGILLKVVPAVGADKRTINLSLIPEVSEGTADGFSYTGDVTLPKFTSRNLSTTIVVNSGDTVVLGGLIKESRTKTVTKLPILGDLPWIGQFFRKDVDNVERKNLIIFVTAKVISPAGTEVVVADNK